VIGPNLLYLGVKENFEFKKHM